MTATATEKFPGLRRMKKYLLSDIDIGEAEAEAAAEVVRSKWLSIGPRTAEFEEHFAETMGVRHAVAVSNCTAALHLALFIGQSTSCSGREKKKKIARCPLKLLSSV